MGKKLLLCCLIGFSAFSYAQVKRTANWHFGLLAGLKFTDTGVQVLKDGKLYCTEGCSSMSDSSGNLLLYSDGLRVWNRFNTIVKNSTGLKGHNSSTQSALILPLPESDSIFVVITAPYAYDFYEGMNYSYVNIHGNKDSGELYKKNTLLHFSSAEKVTAVRHQNGRDIWVVGHEFGNNRFYAYLLTKDGFNPCPVLSDQGVVFDRNATFINQCYLKFSHNGKYLCDATEAGGYGRLEFFEFDNADGTITFKNEIKYLAGSYGLDFSPGGKYLYFTENYSNKLKQVDLSNLSIKHIYTSSKLLNAVQLGLNNKIYIAKKGDTSLGVINYPDSPGLKCGYVHNGQPLGGKLSDWGLPNFNQSYLYTPALDFNYTLDCRLNTLDATGYDTFNATVYRWHIRKVFSNDTFALAGSSKNAVLVFSDTGRYLIRCMASNGSHSDTLTKSLYFFPQFNEGFLGKDTIFASGSSFSKTINGPQSAFCNRWFKNDTFSGSGSFFNATSYGTYICKATNKAYCEGEDTIVIAPCNDTLASPIIARSRDSLFVINYQSDSLVWIRNGAVIQSGQKNVLHFSDTGLYSVMVFRPFHCPKTSAGYKVVSVCLDTLANPIITRSRDSLFVVNYASDSVTWYLDGKLVSSGKVNFIHFNDTGSYLAIVHRPFHCPKTSAGYRVASVCLDQLPRPVITRLKDTLMVQNLVADSLFWYRNSVYYAGSTSMNMTIYDTGTYTVTAFKRFLCPENSMAFFVGKLSVGMNNPSFNQNFIKVFPNPSEGLVNIECPHPFQLFVFDKLTRLIVTAENPEAIQLSSGIYTFQFSCLQTVYTIKVVVF